MIAVLMLVSCEKVDPYHEDGSQITAVEAVAIVKPIIQKYAEEGRHWPISQDRGI